VVGPDLAPYARQLFREAGWRQQADDAIRVRQIDSAGNLTGGPSSAPAILERLILRLEGKAAAAEEADPAAGQNPPRRPI